MPFTLISETPLSPLLFTTALQSLGTAIKYWRKQWRPLQYSCLENPMDGGAWWAAVHEVTKSWTRLSNYHFLLVRELNWWDVINYAIWFQDSRLTNKLNFVLVTFSSVLGFSN